LSEQVRNKRPLIHYLLNNWKGALYFQYAQVRDKRVSLAVLERALNDALLPPYNQNDFTAEVRDLRKAFP